MTGIIVVGILATVLIMLYRKDYGRRLTQKEQEIDKSNKELATLLQQGHMQLWTYDTSTGLYYWMDDDRAQFIELQPKHFFSRYSKKVGKHINLAIQEVIRGENDKKTLRIAQVMKDGNKRYFALDMIVVRRDREGHVSLIATFQNDITEVYLRENKDKELRMRYESIFNSAMIDMVYYDSQGHISDMNQRACQTFGIDVDTAKQLGISVEMAVNEPGFDHHNFDSFHATQFRPSTLAENHVKSKKLQGKMCYEIQITPVFDARHRMVCAYGYGLNVTDVADAYYTMQEYIRQTQEANNALAAYVRNIDFAMKVGGVRLVEYDPLSRVLTVYKEINKIQIALTADRAMRYIDSTSRNIVQHMFERMDDGTTLPFNHQVKTIIRQPSHLTLHLYVYFMPTYDEQHRVNGYFGMMRDFTEAKSIERDLANETIRARQEETQKNNFMRNMSFEIRTLLNTVVGFAELFRKEHSADEEEVYISQLKDNGSQLLNLVNSILLLSRLNAGMVESTLRRTNLVLMLDSWCKAGYSDFTHEGVDYIVERPYEQFVADIDATNLGIVVTQLCSNGARLTFHGCVRTYYSYADGRLAISIESHGQGLTTSQLETIYDYFGSAMQTGTGLSLPICHRIMELLGGTIDIQSETGRQTTITVTLPCQPIEAVPAAPTADSKPRAKSQQQ